MSVEPSSMEFTGERFVPGVRGNIELEHLHRYLLACEIAAGKVVLDIASGEGYGSAMLAKNADRVIGVDISVEAVAHARRCYQNEKLKYEVGSCGNIPLQDASVDMVASFETIEHHDQHEEMMREVKRVLRPAGVLLISSPDKYHFSEEPGYNNPYHVKELYKQEFKQLVERYFKNVVYFGQRVVCGSAIFPESLATPAVSYWRANDVINECAGIAKPIYWIAIASDVELPKLAAGIFEQTAGNSWIADPMQAVAERDGQIAGLTRVIAERDLHIANLTRMVAAIYASRSWRLTRAFRVIRTWFSG